MLEEPVVLMFVTFFIRTMIITLVPPSSNRMTNIKRKSAHVQDTDYMVKKLPKLLLQLMVLLLHSAQVVFREHFASRLGDMNDSPGTWYLVPGTW